MKPKLLCILHRSPPEHGAAKVGDFIASSKKLHDNYDCHFITIKSSDTLADIGKVNFKKFYLVAELYVKVIWNLLIFHPQKIYFTASTGGAAFYRDVFVSTLWRVYQFFKHVDIYYHYHTKGINQFVSASELNLKLTRFFVNDVNLLLLSPMLKKDFKKVQTFKNTFYLPNGVEDTLEDVDFNEFVESKYRRHDTLEILYLSNMIKSKGYFDVLELAKQTKGKPIQYHFAGRWQNFDDEEEFFNYIQLHKLEDSVTFHGFVNGDKKHMLFENAHLFIFPTRYKNEAFPLSILEAMSYGIPAITTDEGSIPYILDEKSGIVLHDVNKLPEALKQAKQYLLNKETAMYCRQRYLDNFSLGHFEDNLVKALSD